MTSLIVASFTNEEQAIEASHKLSELESFGDVSVYEKVIVKKNADGEVSMVQSDETSAGLRTVSGMAIGSLIGALAGPVGMMAGMVSGTVTGALLDADHYDFSEDFGSKATNKLKPGTTAIIAEIDEDSPDFIDNAFAPLGATVLRSDVDYEYDEYVDDQIDEIDEEIAAQRARIKSAGAAEKTKIQQKIAQLKDRRNKKISEAKAKHEQTVAKISLSAKEKKLSRLRDRIDKHQTKITALQEKLKSIEV